MRFMIYDWYVLTSDSQKNYHNRMIQEQIADFPGAHVRVFLQLNLASMRVR